MKKNLKIVLAFSTVIILIIGGWFIWNSYTQQGPQIQVEKPIKPIIGQGVYGVVRISPLLGGMPEIENEEPLFEKMIQPLLNITRQIIEYFEKDQSDIIPPLLIKLQIREYFGKDQRAGKIIASTTTDKNYFYEIALPEGTYFLTVVDVDDTYVPYASITTGYQRNNFLESERINNYEIINITSNEINEQNILVDRYILPS